MTPHWTYLLYFSLQAYYLIFLAFTDNLWEPNFKFKAFSVIISSYKDLFITYSILSLAIDVTSLSFCSAKLSLSIIIGSFSNSSLESVSKKWIFLPWGSLSFLLIGNPNSTLCKFWKCLYLAFPYWIIPEVDQENQMRFIYSFFHLSHIKIYRH